MAVSELVYFISPDRYYILTSPVNTGVLPSFNNIHGRGNQYHLTWNLDKSTKQSLTSVLPVPESGVMAIRACSPTWNSNARTPAATELT